MRVNRTFSIPHSTIIDLNNNIPAKYRSKFVSKAIRNRLDDMDAFDLYDIDITELLFHLCMRSEIGTVHMKIIEEMYKEMKK